jgi:hypothetical protein
MSCRRGWDCHGTPRRHRRRTAFSLEQRAGCLDWPSWKPFWEQLCTGHQAGLVTRHKHYYRYSLETWQTVSVGGTQLKGKNGAGGILGGNAMVCRVTCQPARTLPVLQVLSTTRSVLCLELFDRCMRMGKSLEDLFVIVSRPQQCKLGTGPRYADRQTYRQRDRSAKMQFPVLGPGWDDSQFWLQLQPRRQSDPTLHDKQAAWTKVSADRPETSVAARPWSSPA